MLRSLTDRRFLGAGVVFDMDGVLLNSSPIHDAAYREALAALPIRNFRYSRVAGMRSADGIRAVLADNSIELNDDRITELAQAKTRIALERIQAENPIVDGARTVLSTLGKRTRLALATSASPAATDSFLDRNDLRALFSAVVHSGDVARAKPAPDIFLLAIERLGIEPPEALVIEDAIAGVQAAKAARAAVCAIPTTCRATDLVQAGADFLIDRLEDLLAFGVTR